MTIARSGRFVVLFSLLTYCFSLQESPKTTSEARFQPWVKKGVILQPGFAGTLSSSGLSAPTVVRMKDGRLRLYFWAREKGFGYIYAAEASPKDIFNWKLVSEQPMLGPTPGDKLNDHGPSFPWVIERDDGSWLMYYCVWGSWAAPGEISNRTDVAISHDQGITWTLLKEPMLALGPPKSHDAGLTGSVDVMKIGPKEYQMWYTGCSHYVPFGEIKRGICNIGHATSEDAVVWNKDPDAVLAPRLDTVSPYEAVVSKPSVLLLNGVYHMWFSVFSMGEVRGYRLGYATSKDGQHWHRFFDKEVLPLTIGGFDSRNQSYANVIEEGDELWMFYVGNDFGATGIGLATMKKKELRD